MADFREESTDADDGPIVADGFWISLQTRAEIAIDQLAWARRADDVEDLSSSEDEASSDDDAPGRGPPDDDDAPGRGPPEDDDDSPGGGPPEDDRGR